MKNPDAVIKFWLEDIEPSQWWQKDKDFDAHIKNAFGDLHHRAAACELYEWRSTAKGRLAEIIVLDQFSRNIFRDSAKAFACDALALGLAQEAVASKADQELSPAQNAFLYMPYMHSESLVIHCVAETLFKENGIEKNYEFELKHKNIIERFGRYPHRNEILGRQSTKEELAFLEEDGSSF